MGAIINYSVKSRQITKGEIYRRKRRCGLCKPYNAV